MAMTLSGLSELGLDHLEDIDIFATPPKEEKKKEAPTTPKAPELQEKDFIFEKTMECPVCGRSFTTKIMKTGKAKLEATDRDLRPRYHGIDATKYDVILCTKCGYAAISRFFPRVTGVQSKLIRENISNKVRLASVGGETYSYEEAMERYKLALAAAVVKRAKTSEKAFICLKSAWLLRGYAESLENTEAADEARMKDIAAKEEEYLQNAYVGFLEARQSENLPICGMDANTVDYLLAVLAVHFQKYEVASRMVATILTSATANNRIKDKSRELKDEILTELRNQKSKPDPKQ